MTIIEENQNCWKAGFLPDDPSALWVKGWQPAPDYDTWQKLDVPLADIVIWTLLNNLVMLAEPDDLEWVETEQTPLVPQLVWSSQATLMGLTKGFWTDNDRAVLFHKGYNFVARRRLYAEVARLKSATAEPKTNIAWIERIAGSFIDDPDYKAAAKLGRAYRRRQPKC